MLACKSALTFHIPSVPEVFSAFQESVAVVLVAVAAAVVATTFVVEYSSDWHCKHWFVVVVASNCIAAL